MSDTTSPLARELEQRVPFRNRSHEATVGLVRTATLLELVGTMERELRIRVPDEKLVGLVTVGQLLELVEGRITQAA